MKKRYTDEELLQSRLAGELPRIDIAGHPFIVDWRLRELRPLDDFSTRIDLRGLAIDAEGQHFLCFYHIPTRSVWQFRDTITELPKDTVMLEIPTELQLDPVGVALEYGRDYSYMLKNYPIRPELKAKVIPLEETALPDIVQKNRAKQQVKANRKSNRHKRGLK